MKIMTLIALVLLCGCNPMTVICFDDPDCPRQYYYCPIENKKVHVNRGNISSECEPEVCLCPEIFNPRTCEWCTTTYKDDQGHTWSTKPKKEIYYGNKIPENRCK